MAVFDLTGRTTLVTGGGRGIGLGIARFMGRQGARIVLNDLFADRAEQGVADLVAEGIDALAAPFDVTDFDAVATAVAGLGDIDILVNNAGIPGREGMALQPFLDSDPAGWKAQVDLNLYGTLYCTHQVLPGMCERGWGRVVVVSSDAGRIGSNAGVSIYGSCKAGAVQLVRNLSQEVGGQGVTVNAIALGPMDNLPADYHAHMVRGIPLGRLGSGADAGAAVGFLASDEAGWITGQLLPVNGGLSPA